MTVTIERLGHLGDGIADGPIYAARTLPGEVIEGDTDGNRITTPRIVTPSPERVAPPCRHYKRCGGCALQHASNDFVRDWKAEVVRTALAAVGVAAPVRHIHTSPPGSRRRATFTGRRTKSGAIVGFHTPAANTLRDVPDCQLVRPALTAALPVLGEIVQATASRKSELRFLLIETEGGLDVTVEGGHPLTVEQHQTLVARAQDAGFSRLTWNGDPVATFCPPVLHFGRTRIEPPPGSFLQATSEGETALRQAVIEAIGDQGPVVDLFSGCGTFTLPIAETRAVHAVEDSAQMLDALDAAWRQGDQLSTVTMERRDLFRRPLLADELGKFQAVVIDPPRAGAERQVSELARSSVTRIAFVSCNPVTFARDAAQLVNAGFSIEWIDVIDQFRWSPHVELAAAFAR